ncbi:MAG: hypothetical protein ACYDC4_00430 [Candidatus Dormibacteria bacterium]
MELVAVGGGAPEGEAAAVGLTFGVATTAGAGEHAVSPRSTPAVSQRAL